MIKVAVIDLDGTVYEGNRLITGADSAISNMRKKGLKVIFCTNNSSSTISDIANKLRSLNISCDDDDIVSSGMMAIRYVVENGLDHVYFCGSDKVRAVFDKTTVHLCSPDECEVLIIGMDSSYNYQKMTNGVRAALRAKKIIICNKDKLYPSDDGLKPGCGAIVASILSAVNRDYDVILGKPGIEMLSEVTKRTGCDASEIIVIGDSIDTDIAMAKKYGCTSLLIGEDIESLAETINWDWKCH